MSTSEPSIEIESISHRYGDRQALKDVSCAVPRGCLFGLLGPNGSGKSTLFRILSTLLQPTSGVARVAGHDVVSDPAAVRANIGAVFQSPSVDDRLSVGENLQHQGHLYGLHGDELQRRCRRWLEQFELHDRRTDRVGTLSGGLQRRVELAKALLHDPQVLLLDEPETGLDPAARHMLMSTLQGLCGESGVTIVMTTHHLDDADRCSRLGVLDEGTLVACDTPSALRRSIHGDVITVRGHHLDRVKAGVAEMNDCAVREVGGALVIEAAAADDLLVRLHREYTDQLDSLTVGKPTLADVFLHLTGRRFLEDQPAEVSS